jgi:hypothetical protein
MMPVGPRAYAEARARIAVPVALPKHLRAKFRELVGLKSGNPNNGEADNLLTVICGEADRTGTALFLHCQPEGETDKARLYRWYRSHGFTPVQEEPLLMSRMPA